MNYLLNTGWTILQEGDRFCAIVGDMVTNLKTEIKILRRMNQENILEEIYQVLLKEIFDGFKRCLLVLAFQMIG